ncbi:spiroplasma phage ORF1-like family protein [Spiroplasma poulsonii]|uniref:DUF3688 domain-containing protein n=2 Tax=Spiroplasma poulsonii TaxID=2138 RepID=A0A2P6F8B1_9MOLU|nr:DUF3688 family protein [Spiroplasma poulsonii]PQM29680.1 hypothetical protein SMSRO_SF030810 [Spiroplasma poulsonii]PQM29692.1 hypothetical protein SMSRO_SF030930 [Spiroplasma poulsonii]
MKKFLVWFLTLPILFVSFFSLSAFSVLEKSEVRNETVRKRRNTDFKINEEDFINTMFLRSSFFENWSDTNYFVNPTLKTSKSLTYNENWYLDFLKDGYATGVVFDKPSDKFLELYKNWDNYVKQYKLDRFYNVDKKFFLKDLTNFMYTYFKKYESRSTAIQGKSRQMEQNIKDLQQIKINEDNWKLVDNYQSEFSKKNNNWYSVLFNFEGYKIINFYNSSNEIRVDFNNLTLMKDNDNNLYLYKKWGSPLPIPNINFTVYRWDGINEPIIPTINKNTGEITDWQIGNEQNFFVNVIDEVIKENIRVQQGGGSNYEKLDMNGTQKIIFDFEIIDEVDKDKRKKVVYRMILTINHQQIIRAGNISLLYYLNDEYDSDKLNFNFDFQQSVLDDENLNPLWDFKIDNFVYQNKVKYSYEHLEGLIYINDFLKQFFSNALIPVFTNRGAFMEASYLDFLTYDTVVVNFLGLQANNFLSLVKLNEINIDVTDIDLEIIKSFAINTKLAWGNNYKLKLKDDLWTFYIDNKDTGIVSTNERILASLQNKAQKKFLFYNLSGTINKIIKKYQIVFENKWKNILNSSFKIMNNFYKDYLRTIFDLENETYIQGYQKKFGLLVSNGFKIFPKYFYFSDKYKELDVKIYSSHANKFYQTKYGRVFNFDYSVSNDFKVDNNSNYLFDGVGKEKYKLRYKDLSIQKVGYGVFELQAQQEKEFYHYYDFNFGIYNWKDLTSLVDKPTGQWWSEQIENCKWYDMVCHLKNGAIWIVNNIPGIKQANELASGVGKLFQTTYSFFAQTFEIWKFNLDFYIVITNTFLLIIFMKFIRIF